MPRSASATAATSSHESGWKKSANAGSATSLGEDEERRHADRLPEPDRAPVAGREHEPVERPLLALGGKRTGEPEQRGEDDRDPEQARLGAGGGAGRQREVEDRQRRDDEEEHRGQRVA